MIFNRFCVTIEKTYMLFSANSVFLVGYSYKIRTLESISGQILLKNSLIERAGNCQETVFPVFLKRIF